MNIITSYFCVSRLQHAIQLGDQTHKDKAVRQLEYLLCLRENAEHPEVRSVHLIVEGRAALKHFHQWVLDAPKRRHVSTSRIDDDLPLSTVTFSKVAKKKIIPVLRVDGAGMPLYSDLFAHANRLLCGALCMISNADVYLSQPHFHVRDATALFAQSRSQHKRLALALTRYENPPATVAPLIDCYRGSHDAFVVVPPLPETFIAGVAHPQNCYRAENVVLHELQRAGYVTLNPCRDLRIVHRHEADLRQWLPPISAEGERYGRAEPCTLQQAAAAISAAR